MKPFHERGEGTTRPPGDDSGREPDANGPIPQVSGVILVGGKSRRMGRDKAFLTIDGRSLIDRILEVVRASFERVILVGDRGERFSGCGLDVVPDSHPGSALGGVYAGLLAAGTEYVFVSSCDLAFPNRAVLRYLCSLREGFDAVVPSTSHGYEPLFAVYAKTCLAPIKSQLESGDYCAYAYYPRIRARYVTDAELAPLDREGNAFLNINTPDDFRRAGGGS